MKEFAITLPLAHFYILEKFSVQNRVYGGQRLQGCLYFCDIFSFRTGR